MGAFAAAYAGVLLALVGALARGPLPEARATGQLGLLLAGAAWCVAVRLAPRVPDARALRVAVVVGALALRLAVGLATPELSDDVHRYVWEGGLVAEGQSPYAHAPVAPARAAERERWAAVYARVNHPEVSAAYPPVTQLVCAAAVAAAGGPAAAEGERAAAALRVVFTACDLAVLLLLMRRLRRTGRSPAAAVLWGWSPLVALEFAGSAHFDALGIALLVAAGVWLSSPRERGRQDLALLALGASVLVKLMPVAFVPFAVRDAPRRARAGIVLVASLVLWSVPVLLLEDGLRGLGRGLSEYALRWESFSLLFRGIETPLGWVLERDGSLLDQRRVARAVAATLWVGVVARAWRRGDTLLAAGRSVVGAFLLVTPTLHPWYLTWVMPFVVLRPSVAWTWLVAVAPLLYWPLTGWRAGAGWHEPAWLWPVVALPFLLLLAREAHARRRPARERRT